MTTIYWHTKRLAREFNIHAFMIGRILRDLGAEKVNNGKSGSGAIWCWSDDS